MLHISLNYFAGIKNGQPDASAARRNTAGFTMRQDKKKRIRKA